MIYEMTLISLLIFCSYFPLYYFKILTRPQAKKYFRRTLFWINTIGGIVAIIMLLSRFTMQTKVLAVIWKAALYMSFRYRHVFPPYLSSLIFVFQVICIYFIQQFIVKIDFHYIIILFVFNFLLSSFCFDLGLKKADSRARETSEAQTLY